MRARIDSTTAAVTLRITNEDEGKSEVVTCLFRLVIITILSLSPNSDLRFNFREAFSPAIFFRIEKSNL